MNQNKYSKCGDLRYVIQVLLAVGFMASLSFTRESASAKPISSLYASVEKAALVEDWEKIVSLLPEQMEPNLPAPLRLIKGHACLATNRNNKSLCLFLGASSEVDLSDWGIWTQRFVTDHPESSIAYYLRGDAYARFGERARSLTNFDIALHIDPNHILSLHSRAVTMALDKRWPEARKGLRSCIRLAPAFAAAHVSWGTYIVQRRTDPRIALESFDLALKYSSDNILALNGKGSMETILGDLEQAAEHLNRAHDIAEGCLSDTAPMIGVNELVLAAKVNEEIERNIAKVTGIEPGMTLQEKMTKFSSLPSYQKQQVFDQVSNARHFNQMRQGDILTPGTWSMKSTTSGEIGAVGKLPYAKIGGSRQFEIGRDISSVTKYNINQQTDFLNAVGQKYNIKATPGYNSVGNNIKSFIGNMFGGSRDFSHSGGVSSEQIEDTLDRGDWKVAMIYGLLYSDAEEPMAPHKENQP